MKIKSLKIPSTGPLISIGFGLVVFLFFAFLYPFHLNYQEQFQLFLFSPDYFFSFANRPGGIADYIGNFFTQFYFYKNIGAFILAFLLTLLHRLVYGISLKLGATSRWLPLTLLPAILYWGLLCDENYLLGGLIAVLMATAFTGFYLALQNVAIRRPLALVFLPVLYWLCGGIALVFLLFAIYREFKTSDRRTWKAYAQTLAIIVVSTLLPFLAKHAVVQFPLSRLCVGPNYFRFPDNFPVPVAIIGLLIFILPIGISYLDDKVRIKKDKLFIMLQLFMVLVGSFFYLRASSDMEKEEIMAYDFNVRMRKWDRVIALADKKAPSSPLSVTCLNLALAEEGLLANKMFSYYQNGTQGLIPDFTRDYTIPLIAGEVYYHLGMINTAQRYAFEAMEALPDFQKSARCLMRLAETNIINGDYKVAEKYLKLLEKTFYYRKWARKAMATMQNEKAIAQHPEWGWLRQVEVKNDFLFSETEKDMMLGLLFTANPTNRVAYEYLMASCLLNKDMQHFLQYLPLSKSVGYKVIPKTYQEALLYAWDVTNKDKTKQIPYPINLGVQQRLMGFKTVYQSGNSKTLSNDYSDTFWYYYFSR